MDAGEQLLFFCISRDVAVTLKRRHVYTFRGRLASRIEAEASWIPLVTAINKTDIQTFCRKKHRFWHVFELCVGQQTQLDFPYVKESYI